MVDNDSQSPVNKTEDHAASPFIRKRGVVAVISRGRRLLVIQRSRAVAAPGCYCFPGGAIEQGESEEQALVRELQEELQITVQPLRRLWQSVTRWGVQLSWWQARLEGPGEPTPNWREVEEVRWCTIPEILRLPKLLSSNREFLQKVLAREITLIVDE